MKAKEYFDIYGKAILHDADVGDTDNAYQLLMDMSEETNKIMLDRNAKTSSAITAVFKESNQKWNAICGLFEKVYGKSPLNRDGFKNFWEYRMPELKGNI